MTVLASSVAQGQARPSTANVPIWRLPPVAPLSSGVILAGHTSRDRVEAHRTTATRSTLRVAVGIDAGALLLPPVPPPETSGPHTEGERIPPPAADVSPSAVTLEQAIAECGVRNLEIRAEFERLLQASADFRTSRLAPNPLVQITPSLQPFPGHPFTPTMTGGPPQYDYWVQYPMDWWLFHKRKWASEAAARGMPAVRAEYDEFVRQRIIATVGVFYDVLEGKALLDLANLNVENLERVEKMTNQRVELGGAGTVESDRVRLALFDARRVQSQQALTLANSRYALWSFLGRSGYDPRFDVVGSLEVDAAAPVVGVGRLLSVAEQYRPDLVALRNRAAQVASQRAQGRPQLAGSLGYTHQRQQAALGQPNADSYGAALQATVPLFNRNQGGIARAESEYRQARLAVEARRVQIRAELQQPVESFALAHTQVTQQSPAQLALARGVSEKITTAYQLGGRPLIDVLDSQRAYRETYRLFIGAQAAYWRALHRINLTAGLRVIE